MQHAKARFSELLNARQRLGPELVSRRGFGVEILNPFKYKGPSEQLIGVDLGKNSSWPKRSSGPMGPGQQALVLGAAAAGIDQQQSRSLPTPASPRP